MREVNDMHALTSLVSLPLLAAGLAAQQVSSPSGYLTTEGNSAAMAVFASHHTMTTTYGHVDDTLRGQGARSIGGIALRRDGMLPGSLTYLGRTVQLAGRMAHANWSAVVNNGVQANSEYRATGWAGVIAPRAVSLPPLVAPPSVAPAPFAVSIPFDFPFAYDGTRAFTLSLRTGPHGLGADRPYPLDFIDGPSYVRGDTNVLGSGCRVAGRSADMRLSSLLTSFGDPGMSYWQLLVNDAPASAPAALVLGGASADVAFGGCAHLRVRPDIVLGLGASNANGSTSVLFDFRHHPAFIGAHLYTQALAADAGQPGVPVALSPGVESIYPRNPITHPRVAFGVAWTSGTGWLDSLRMVKASALVLGLN